MMTSKPSHRDRSWPRRKFLGATAAGVCGSTFAVQAQPQVLREFRAAWVASVHHIDWPAKKGLSAWSLRKSLVSLIERAHRMGLNALFLQVRPAADALYQSRLEPWSPWLTGAMGRSLTAQKGGFDPLQLAIEVAHAKKMELHAWINPFRALASDKQAVVASHVTRSKREWCVPYHGQVWMDPGHPEVREHTMRVAADLLDRYAIDGLHMDDYFYPYPKRKGVVDFDDSRSWARFGKVAGHGSREDWRRANVNDLVRRLYTMVRAKGGGRRFGISPFGIWRPKHPSSIEADLDAFGHLFADSRLWLREGWVDYLSPQLYWKIDRKPQSFATLLKWWAKENVKGRDLWPGIATARVGPKTSAWPARPASEILKQMALCRGVQPNGRYGHVHWSVSSLLEDRGGIQKLLKGADGYGRWAALPLKR